MNTYIILAYPNKKGLTYAAYEAIKKGLHEAGNDIRVLDLYEENFNPVLFLMKTTKEGSCNSLLKQKSTEILLLGRIGWFLCSPYGGPACLPF